MKKTVLFNILLFGIVLYLPGQTINKSDFSSLEKIARENMKYESFVSDFRQVQHLVILGEEILSEGKCYYKKPDKLAMQYTEPKGDMMVINEDRFIMVSGGKRRETSAKSNDKMLGLKTILCACMDGNVMQMGAKKISSSETNKHYIVTAEFDASQDKNMFSKVIIHYDKNDLSLSSLQTIEPDGSSILYELSNKKFNEPIDDNIFQSPRKKK